MWSSFKYIGNWRCSKIIISIHYFVSSSKVRKVVGWLSSVGVLGHQPCVASFAGDFAHVTKCAAEGFEVCTKTKIIDHNIKKKKSLLKFMNQVYDVISESKHPDSKVDGKKMTTYCCNFLPLKARIDNN